MSHSQFRRIKTYTETCMDESLRQAYDYWQDQPGSIRRNVRRITQTNCWLKVSIMVNSHAIACMSAKIRYHMLDKLFLTHEIGCYFSKPKPLLSKPTTRLQAFTNSKHFHCDYRLRQAYEYKFTRSFGGITPTSNATCHFTRGLHRADRHFGSRLPCLPHQAQTNWSALNSSNRHFWLSDSSNASRNTVAYGMPILRFHQL